MEVLLDSVLLSFVATEFGGSLKFEGNVYSESIGINVVVTKYNYVKYSYKADPDNAAVLLVPTDESVSSTLLLGRPEGSITISLDIPLDLGLSNISGVMLSLLYERLLFCPVLHLLTFGVGGKSASKFPVLGPSGFDGPISCSSSL